MKLISRRAPLQALTAFSAIFVTFTGTNFLPNVAAQNTNSDTDILNEAAISAATERFTMQGDFTQGGLVFGEVIEKGTIITLDSQNIPIDSEGNFVFGFGRNHGESALLTVEYPDGTSDTRALAIESRKFKIQRINNLPASQVNQFNAEHLEKIKISTNKKNAARAKTIEEAKWISKFQWPTSGKITGVFGSQRILNGVPKRPHSGLDIANSTGTLVRAPAAGVVTLADDDMYFEGGLVLINHGQGLESALMHLSRLDVVANQPVEKGDVIGAIGATGRTTGPHLHWSLKLRKNLVDPQLLVKDMDMPEKEKE